MRGKPATSGNLRKGTQVIRNVFTKMFSNETINSTLKRLLKLGLFTNWLHQEEKKNLKRGWSSLLLLPRRRCRCRYSGLCNVFMFEALTSQVSIWIL